MKQTELATMVERSPASVSKWEQEGGQSPEPIVISRLAEVLKVDQGWFFKPCLPTKSASFFRSKKTELRSVCAKFDARLSFVESIEQALSEFVDFPVVDIPDLLGGRRYDQLHVEDIEKITIDLRHYWGLADDPIEDILLIIENSGAIIGHDATGSTKLDGLSRWGGNGKPYILLAVDKNVAVRRRFDAAHELGHLVLHRYVEQAEQIENFDLIERQAMDFAGALLMPSASFSEDVYSLSLDALLNIKGRWKTSVASMIMRLRSLDIIDEFYKRRLFQYYSMRGWRTGEPLDEALPIESPHNLAAAIDVVIESNELSAAGLVRATGLLPETLSELTGADLSRLASFGRNVTRLAVQSRRSYSELESDSRATVIDLAGRRKS